MVKRRRRWKISSNLLSRCKVSSEGGEVGITLCGHLVGTYGGGGGPIGHKFQRNSSFWLPFSFTRERKSNWDFKSDQLLDDIFIGKSNAEERFNFLLSQSFKIELKTNLFIKTLSYFGLFYLCLNLRLETPC